MEQYVELMLGEDISNSIELLRESAIELKYSVDIHYECDGHVKMIDVDAVENDCNDNGEEIQNKLGYVKLNMIRHLGWVDYREAWDFCDVISQNFVDGFESCFKDENSKNKTKFSLEAFSEYIYIDLLKIEENARGRKIGTAIIHEIIDTIGKMDSLFVVVPFAIEDSENKNAHIRVKKFWENIGFKKMSNSRFYYFSPRESF